MAVSIQSSPGAVSLSGSPIDYRLFDSQVPERMRLYLFMESESGKGDFEAVYAEERSFAQASDTPVFRLSSVIHAELSHQFPQDTNSAFHAKQASKRYFATTAERYASEVLAGSTGTATVAGQYSPLSSSLQAGKLYRIEASYREDYQDGQGNELLLSGAGSRRFFGGREWRYGDKLVEVFYSEYAYDQAKLNADGWRVYFYEIPIQPKTAIRGGRSLTDFIPYSGETPGSLRLLSSMPENRQYVPGQLAWAWISIADQAQAEVVCQATAYYANGTSERNFTAGDPASGDSFAVNGAQGQVFAIPLHRIVELNANPQETLLRMEIDLLVNTEPAYPAGPVRISLHSNYGGYPYLREFHFANSLGGFDWIIAYGKATRSEEMQAEEYATHAQYDAGQYANSYPSHAREFARRVQSARTRFKASIGYRSLEEREAARDLLRSETAFIREDGKMIPITVLSQKADYEKDGDRRYTLSFEYSYAFDSRYL